MQDSIRQIVFGRVLSQLRGCFCATPYNSPCLVRSFVLILTQDNGSEPKKVCMRCDEGHLRGRKSGFSLLLSRLYTSRPPVSSALSAKRRLHRTSGNGEGGQLKGLWMAVLARGAREI